MRDRILKNWTLIRVIYFIVGSTLLVNALMDQQWLGVLFGSYFTSMALFNYGCAAGNCAAPSVSDKTTNTGSEAIIYEEIKEK